MSTSMEMEARTRVSISKIVHCFAHPLVIHIEFICTRPIFKNKLVKSSTYFFIADLLPYGYRLPMLSKSQHDIAVRSLMANDVNHIQPHKSECSKPKCAILRSLVEQNVPMSNKSSMPFVFLLKPHRNFPISEESTNF